MKIEEIKKLMIEAREDPIGEAQDNWIAAFGLKLLAMAATIAELKDNIAFACDCGVGDERDKLIEQLDDLLGEK